MNMIKVPVNALTAAAFAPYGDVIQANDKVEHFPINDGSTERYHDLGKIDVAQNGGRAAVSIFRAKPQRLPIFIKQMERHPLGSQMFMPRSDQPYLVIVAPAGDFDPEKIEAFVATRNQGVNYHAGVWHHYCLALNQECDFLVIDRCAEGESESDKVETVSLDGSMVVDFGLK